MPQEIWVVYVHDGYHSYDIGYFTSLEVAKKRIASRLQRPKWGNKEWHSTPTWRFTENNLWEIRGMDNWFLIKRKHLDGMGLRDTPILADGNPDPDKWLELWSEDEEKEEEE